MKLNRNLVVICVTVFATCSSIAWAVAALKLYGPPTTALNECMWGDAKNSVFCVELAKNSKHN